MDLKRNQATEYATQFFDFVPQCFVDELNQSCQELVMDALGVIKTKIAGKYDGKLEPAVIEAGMQKVEDKYSEEFDKIFEKVGKFTTENILRVPPHVLLPEDEVWDSERPGSISAKSANVDVELEALRNKIKTASYKKAMLSKSLVTVQDIRNQQQSHIKTYEELLNSFNVSDWKDMVGLTLENRITLSKRIKAIQVDADLSSEVESLFSSKQQNINSNNCARILEELKKKYSLADSGNELPV